MKGDADIDQDVFAYGQLQNDHIVGPTSLLQDSVRGLTLTLILALT